MNNSKLINSKLIKSFFVLSMLINFSVLKASYGSACRKESLSPVSVIEGSKDLKAKAPKLQRNLNALKTLHDFGILSILLNKIKRHPGKKGDVICFYGAFANLLGDRSPLIHAAVDMGDGTVIGWSRGAAGNNNQFASPLGEIRQYTKKEFIGESPSGKIFVLPVRTQRSPDEIVDQARDYFSNPQKVGPYDILYNNCQHFATLCATGTRISPQADFLGRSLESSPLMHQAYLSLCGCFLR